MCRSSASGSGARPSRTGSPAPCCAAFPRPGRRGGSSCSGLHGEVGVPSSRYDPVSEEELAASGLDYAAFGHVHAFSGLRRAGDCFYAWPGCPEGRGFDETGEKGVIIADVERGGVKLRFAPSAPGATSGWRWTPPSLRASACPRARRGTYTA